MRAYIRWRVWYDDGAIYASDEHSWADLPDDGVLVRIIYYADGTKQIQQGTDYYYEAPHFSGEPVLGAGMDKDEIEKRYPGAIIKRGRWCPDEFYKKIVAEAFKSSAP